MGTGSEARAVNTLEGRKPKRGSAAGSGATPAERERTRRRIKASKRVKLAEQDGFRSLVSRGTRKHAFGYVEREPIVVRGSGQLRERVGVPETGGDKTRVRPFGTPVDDRKGAERPWEGRAIPVRGNL